MSDQPAYAGKLLEVRKGCRLSLQYHERKTETLYLLSGRVRLTYRATSPGAVPSAAEVTPADCFDWAPGRALHVPVGTIHRFEALEDSVLAEVSTPDLTDVVRLQDDFSRPARD